MVTVRFVTVDPCAHAPCEACAHAEQAVRTAMESLGEVVPGGRDGPTWRALGFTEGELHWEHLHADEAGLDLAHAPYLLLDELVLMQGRDWDDDEAARLIARALYPAGWA